MNFGIGDRVEWTSGAGGYTKTKRGVVVGVVNEGDRPSRALYADLYRGPGVGLGRHGESYVVRVHTRHFWPWASRLKPVVSE